MDVLDSPLNLAHKYGRKADSLTVAGRIDEAIHYHNQAAACLCEALSMTTADKATESLRLQCDWHRRQADMLGCATRTGPAGADGTGAGDVHRTIDECDALLRFLRHRASGTVAPPVEEKRYREARSPVAELRTQNDALRGYVADLLGELAMCQDEVDASRTENLRLRRRLELRSRTDTLTDCDAADNDDDDALLFPLELPPLELPEFDFSSLTPRSTL